MLYFRGSVRGENIQSHMGASLSEARFDALVHDNLELPAVPKGTEVLPGGCLREIGTTECSEDCPGVAFDRSTSATKPLSTFPHPPPTESLVALIPGSRHLHGERKPHPWRRPRTPRSHGRPSMPVRLLILIYPDNFVCTNERVDPRRYR